MHEDVFFPTYVPYHPFSSCSYDMYASSITRTHSPHMQGMSPSPFFSLHNTWQIDDMIRNPELSIRM